MERVRGEGNLRYPGLGDSEAVMGWETCSNLKGGGGGQRETRGVGVLRFRIIS